MAVRIHFETADLARTTIAPRPDPLWEVLLGLHMLQTDDEPAVYGGWRQRTRARLTSIERGLLTLAPPVGYSPDFLTPAAASDGLDAGLSTVRSTPRPRVAEELDRLGDGVRLPRWTKRLAAGDDVVLAKIVDGLRYFHRTKIEPQWPVMTAAVAREVSARQALVTSSGLESLLNSLHPIISWQAPVLTIDLPHIERDQYLRGRGLRLVPSYFCWKNPLMLLDPELPPVLVYPVQHDRAFAEPAVVDSERALGDLIGRTRAAVLRAVAAGACSGGELAARAEISRASASEHARVLAEAGLITMLRAGSAVRHTVTPTGTDVIKGKARFQPPAPRFVPRGTGA